MTAFFGPKFCLLAEKSAETVHFPPWERFLDFPFLFLIFIPSSALGAFVRVKAHVMVSRPLRKNDLNKGDHSIMFHEMFHIFESLFSIAGRTIL